MKTTMTAIKTAWIKVLDWTHRKEDGAKMKMSVVTTESEAVSSKERIFMFILILYGGPI